MSAIKIIQAYAKKSLTKNQGSGITTLPSQFMAESKAGEIAAILQQAGMPLQQLDNFIRSEADLLKFLNIIENASKPRVIPGTSAEGKAITEKLFGKRGEVIKGNFGKSFKEEIDAMKKSGDIVDEDNMVISDKITDREMFKNSNLNKPTVEGQMEKITNASNRIKEIQKEQAAMYKPKVDTVEETVTYIKTLEPMTALKEANLVIGRKGKYKDLTPEQSKKILTDTEDHIFERDIPVDPEDMAKGGRAGFYTGGITDVEPSLDDIGHGSDSLMARTRLVSPGSQATTSTGLNYLLAEDNDNIRVPFNAGGGDPKRRLFLKLLATLGGATAAAKSGILTLGEGGAKKAITETVKQSAGSGTPPPYFFKLVEKIKMMGDDITEKAATQEREIVKRYKDYEMTEDIGTGNIVIKKRNEGVFYDQDGIISDEYIVYKPGQADELTKGKKPPPEYDEYTVRPDSDGKLKDSEDGLDSIDEILEEVGDTTAMTIKKADGGRIGFSAGGGKFLLSKLGINSTTTRFLEKVFGKQKFQNLIENDPEMHRGLLEVAEMFRSKDKAGLVKYMQNFLPQMSKKELEAFVVGSGDTAGIEGQLIRLGSGRDYKNKIEMIEESNNLRKLKDFDIDGVSKNAEGGRIGFSGGGIFRAIIAKAAANAGTTSYDFIKKTGYKSLPPKIKMFMSKSDYEKLKFGQEEMYSNYVDMAKTRLDFQKQIEGGKTSPARELFENAEKIMDEQSYVPKNVTDKDIAEMELMIKNRFQKGRKDNAEGGLQTMLGE